MYSQFMMHGQKNIKFPDDGFFVNRNMLEQPV